MILALIIAAWWDRSHGSGSLIAYKQTITGTMVCQQLMLLLNAQGNYIQWPGDQVTTAEMVEIIKKLQLYNRCCPELLAACRTHNEKWMSSNHIAGQQYPCKWTMGTCTVHGQYMDSTCTVHGSICGHWAGAKIERWGSITISNDAAVMKQNHSYVYTLVSGRHETVDSPPRPVE